MTLSAKQEMFVLAYVGRASFNAAEAARQAGYSARTADRQGSRLLKNAEISARVREMLEATALSSAEILAHLAAIATAPWSDFVTERYHPRTGEVIERRMDLSAKVRALELLGKHHQLFTDKVNITGDFLDALRAFGRGDVGAPITPLREIAS